MKMPFIILTILISAATANERPLFQDTLNDCNSGNARACFEAGQLYSNIIKNSQYNAANTASKSAKLYKKSCELGYIKGCTAYGMSYYADKDRDPEKNDLYYFNKACEGGDEVGCRLLKMAPLLH